MQVRVILWYTKQIIYELIWYVKINYNFTFRFYFFQKTQKQNFKQEH